MFDFQKFIITGIFLAIAFVSAKADDSKEKTFSYIPNIHGTVRPRFELDSKSGDARFAMRNSRLSLDGKVAPEIDYFLQLDLCDQGTFKPLDFYVRLQVATGLRVQAGQFRVPFGVETFRGQIGRAHV